jgi:hypothetical protein
VIFFRHQPADCHQREPGLALFRSAGSIQRLSHRAIQNSDNFPPSRERRACKIPLGRFAHGHHKVAEARSE